MANKIFEHGREYQKLVNQLEAIFEEVTSPKTEEKRNHFRESFKHVANDVYSKIQSLSGKYNVDINEQRSNARIHGSCLDEKFFQNYLGELIEMKKRFDKSR